jgi:hypothetical protein
MQIDVSLAHCDELLFLPFSQACMLADRQSTIESSFLPLNAALKNELRITQLKLSAQDIQSGAAVFMKGAGRHGQFGAAPEQKHTQKQSSAAQRAFDCVTFDLGGVIIDSPVVMISEYEKVLGLTPHTLNKLMAFSPAFADLETGRCSLKVRTTLICSHCKLNIHHAFELIVSFVAC